MNPLLKKALVAVAAKQVLEKVIGRRRESRRSTLARVAPMALVGLGAAAALWLYRSKRAER